MSLNEWKELGFICIVCFYCSLFVLSFFKTILELKKRQAKMQKELRHLRWKEAMYRCSY